MSIQQILLCGILIQAVPPRVFHQGLSIVSLGACTGGRYLEDWAQDPKAACTRMDHKHEIDIAGLKGAVPKRRNTDTTEALLLSRRS